MNNESFTLLVKIVNKSDNPLPAYETSGSAGMDVRAFEPGPVIIKPGERQLIHTGLYMQIPQGYECQVRPRSGLALKTGVTVLNAPGTVDSDYRNEVGVILYNASHDDFVVNSGDRIAQLVFARHEITKWDTSDELDMDNDRGGGFGHTGI